MSVHRIESDPFEPTATEFARDVLVSDLRQSEAFQVSDEIWGWMAPLMRPHLDRICAEIADSDQYAGLWGANWREAAGKQVLEHAVDELAFLIEHAGPLDPAPAASQND